MLTHNLLRGVTMLACGLLAVAVTAGCGSRTVASTPTSSPGVTLSAPANPATTTVTPAPPTTSPPGVPECTAANLRLALRFDGVAAGSSYQDLVFTTSGGTGCVIVGFPGVSYVTGDDGRQVGAAAVRVGPAGAPVVLAPDGSAYATVQQANSGNYDPATCQPIPALGLRVYPPDDRAAMYVPFTSTTTACANLELPVAQLRVQAVQARPGPR